jgi:hypothetical protein
MKDSARPRPGPTVTLLDGQVASKAAVDEIVDRIRAVKREWPGPYAVESLFDIALSMDDSSSILDPLQAKVLHKHQLITTPDVPVTREQITGGPDGLIAAVVGCSFRHARGDVHMICPYQQQ